MIWGYHYFWKHPFVVGTYFFKKTKCSSKCIDRRYEQTTHPTITSKDRLQFGLRIPFVYIEWCCKYLEILEMHRHLSIYFWTSKICAFLGYHIPVKSSSDGIGHGGHGLIQKGHQGVGRFSCFAMTSRSNPQDLFRMNLSTLETCFEYLFVKYHFAQWISICLYHEFLVVGFL